MLMPTLDEKTHQYTMPDGRVVDGLTSLLQRAGVIDTTWYTPEARDRGTAVHVMIEDFHGSRFSNDEWRNSIAPQYPFFKAYLQFKDACSFLPQKIEHVVYCATQDYACKIDQYGIWDDGVHSLIEIKTGQRPPWVGIQLAAQQQACFESGLPPTRLYSLELRGNGTFDLKEHLAHENLGKFLEARKRVRLEGL